MKIDELARPYPTRLSPLKRRLLEYLESKADEVFSYRDAGLAQELSIKPSALRFALWSLERDGLIEKQEINERVYFGSRKAIERARERLGLSKPDPWQSARATAERIRGRAGPIDVVDLLDSVRGPWEAQ